MKSEMKEISQRGTLVVIVPKVIWPTMMFSSQNPAIGINLDKKNGFIISVAKKCRIYMN
jgi:hypothetical protein